MHELSISRAVVREVEAALAARPDVTVTVVRLQVGRLSGIVAPALAYGMSFVTVGTRLEGATVDITEEDVAIWCDPCGLVTTTTGSSVCCPRCDTPSADIRAGKGMQIISLDLADADLADADLADGDPAERDMADASLLVAP